MDTPTAAALVAALDEPHVDLLAETLTIEAAGGMRTKGGIGMTWLG
jgi:hypothetical protein